MSTSKSPTRNVIPRNSFGRANEQENLSSLIEIQTDSYKWLFTDGLRELFEEISPIRDFTGKNLELSFGSYYLDKPKHDEFTSRERNITYEAALYVEAKLVNKITGKTKTQEVYLGDYPVQTNRGTFVINGVERVVVSQLIKAPGVFFTSENARGRQWYGAKIIPSRGAWLEFDTDSSGVIGVKIDRKRRLPVTALLRVFGLVDRGSILSEFADVDTASDIRYIEATLDKDPSTSVEDGFKEVYKRVRPGDLATAENAKSLISSMFFSAERYDLSEVGRFKLNQRLNLNNEGYLLTLQDMVAVIKEIIRMNISQSQHDDIDHLANRRIKAVGELLQQRFRIGFSRMARVARDRMSLADLDTVVPAQLIHLRPIVGSVQEFFSSSQLSQFMDQTNPLAELEHKRRLSAMGPGGLSRERAGFEVRDVHHSHYGRLCPVSTPEGPNIGLISHLATYSKMNKFGFLETPYRMVKKSAKNNGKDGVGEILSQDLKSDSGKLLGAAGAVVSNELAKTLKDEYSSDIFPVRSRLTGEVRYMDAHQEEKLVIGQATTLVDENGYFVDQRVPARVQSVPSIAHTQDLDCIDVSPKQLVSVATSLIPFLAHDDAARALMGSNMQRQAVSCLIPQAPVIGTGMEAKAARDSGVLVLAEESGVVKEVTGEQIVVTEDDGTDKVYKLLKFARTNNGTCLNQLPRVDKGDKVKKGDLLADGGSTYKGELALGQNVVVAFLSWEGYTFEDAIILSSRLIQDDRFSSIHIEEFKIDVRDTKLGPEVVTRDIPNVGEASLRDLDENGIIRIGATVKSGSILVGKITPKGESDLTSEERLLRVIFGEKSRDVKDTSLTLPHGETGKVVSIREWSREAGAKLPSGVIRTIQVYIAVVRKIQVGDKMAGRHGNKGVISKILPVEDMPFLPDGRPVDIILNPLGVVSRMNLGQILETHMGMAASTLGYNVATPAFDDVPEETIRAELQKAGYDEDGKVTLYNGRTGEPFNERVTVGVAYMLKLHHLVDDKMHARSICPYSLITQQPLGGKAQFGGQRFGEMEVWALEGYGAAHILREMLTIKSDDMVGRSKTYESIVKNEPIQHPHTPESFHVLVKELQAMCLDVELRGLPSGGIGLQPQLTGQADDLPVVSSDDSIINDSSLEE